jgi:NDP-sugar pyrophosphorylase family protein
MKRFDVTWWGKMATFLLMFALPGLLLGQSDFRYKTSFKSVGGHAASPASSSVIGPQSPTFPSFASTCARVEQNEHPRGTHHERPANMKAVIMAGGEGTRLRPLTSNAPKPMLPIANVPMMEHVINLLRLHGFDEIVVTVAFLANAIKTYFGDGSEFGVTMHYAHEAVPLGTAGSVGNARHLLDERFLVISGDVMTDMDLGAIVEFHDAHKAIATIGLTPVENPLDFGIVITREDGTIERFLEKPTWGQVFSDTINTGIYVLEPSIFDYIPEGRSVDFSSDVFPQLLTRGLPLYGAVAEGFWEDVGTLEAYLRAHKDVLDQKVQLDIPGFRVSEDIWLGEGAEVSPDATVNGPAVIGPGCKVEAGCYLGEYTVLGSNVRLLPDVHVERSVLHDNVYVGTGARLRGAVIGRSCSIRSNVRIDEGVVLGDSVFVGSGAVLNGDVKVYPFKTIEDGAIVNSSIVWESKGSRSLFGRWRHWTGQRRCHPRASRQVGDGARNIVEEGHHGRYLPRLQSCGTHVEEGNHGRAECRWCRCTRPRGGQRAGHSVPHTFATRFCRTHGALASRRSVASDGSFL